MYYPLTHENGSTDKRYSIAQEFCGHEKPRFVLRYCGEFVAQSISRSAMVMRAVGHRCEAMGATVITAQEEGK